MGFKFYRKRPDIKTWSITVMDTVLTFSLIRPTTPQYIALTATMQAIHSAIDFTKKDLDAEVYATHATPLVEFISAIEGLVDEDEQPIVFDEMPEADQKALILELPYLDIFKLIQVLLDIHTNGDVKKKPSEPTSETSTSTDPAAALSASEE